MACTGLAADTILPREIWIEIARVYPAVWTRLSLVVLAVAADACDPAKRAALMLHFTGADGRLPNGANHGVHLRLNVRGYTTKHWWMGKLHCDKDQPAVIYPDGTREWWQHGKLHRANDKPAVIFAGGEQRWYQHGEILSFSWKTDQL